MGGAKWEEGVDDEDKEENGMTLRRIRNTRSVDKDERWGRRRARGRCGG